MSKRSALNRVGVLMKGVLATTLMMLVLWPVGVHAAVNQATDPGGGGVSLTNSGNVTVTSATLQLMKQVWDLAGSNCLASIPADATCNSSATSITVPAGTALKFLIGGIRMISYMAENALGCAQSRQFRTTSISRLGSQAMFATKQEVS